MMDNYKDLVNCTTVNGDDILKILFSYDDEHINDYVYCWRQRISEEIRSRIATGVITPIRYLDWYPRCDGWNKLDDEVPF